jgi:hypothetical protein
MALEIIGSDYQENVDIQAFVHNGFQKITKAQ